MTADDNNYLLNRGNLTETIQIQLSQKQKTVPELFFAFLKSILNLKYFPKRDDPHSWCISSITGSEERGKINFWKVEFQRTLWQTTSQMGRNTVTIWTTAPLQYLLITVKIVALEKVSLVIRKILRLFVNTLTADEKDYVLNRDNLTQPIHMQLSDKEKIFSQFIFLFLKTILNFKSFSKRDDRHSCCISSITGSEKTGSINV